MTPSVLRVAALKRAIYRTTLPIAAVGTIVVGVAGGQDPGRTTNVWMVPVVLGVAILFASAALFRPQANVQRIERSVLVAAFAAYAVALSIATWFAATAGGNQVDALVRIGLWTPVLVAFAYLALPVAIGRLLAWAVWASFTAAVAVFFAFSSVVDASATTMLIESLLVQLIAIVMIQGIVHVASSAIDRGDRLAELATADSLTGLPNRRAAEEHLDREMLRADRYERPMSLIWFDLDRFKSLNDTYGHEAGDRVLARVGEALRNVLREHDLLARWGGEEFVIVLPEQDLERAARTAERLRDRLAAHDMALPDGTRVTASFGVAERAKGEATRDLLRRADMAMYAAKRAGRDRVHADSEGADPAPPYAGGGSVEFGDPAGRAGAAAIAATEIPEG